MFPHGETVTIRRALAGVDNYGDPIPADWNNPTAITEIEVPGCAVWPRGSSETNDGRSSVTVGIQIALPAGTDLKAHDRIRWRGGDYEVEGLPFTWSNPLTGWAPGVEASARAVTG